MDCAVAGPLAGAGSGSAPCWVRRTRRKPRQVLQPPMRRAGCVRRARFVIGRSLLARRLCTGSWRGQLRPGAAQVVPAWSGSRHPPELVIDPGPARTACLVACRTGVPVDVRRSWATASRCRPVNRLVHDPAPVLLVVKLQMSENTPAVAKRPLTTTLYPVSEARHGVEHVVSGSVRMGGECPQHDHTRCRHPQPGSTQQIVGRDQRIQATQPDTAS